MAELPTLDVTSASVAVTLEDSMTTFRRILVAIDDSGASQRALAMAIAMAAQSQAALRLLHVLDVEPLTEEITYAGACEDSVRQDGRKLLETAQVAAAKAQVAAETVQLEMHSLHDGVADTILRDAHTWGADLLVLGTHGRRGVSRLLLGSVAEAVARGSSIPVLLIPARSFG